MAELFLIGFGRSGTTLLQGILNNHPDINLRYENNLFFNFVRSGLNLDEQHAPEVVASMIEQLSYRGNLARQFLRDLGDIRSIICEARADTLKKAFEALLRSGSDRPIWGDKSPANPFCLAELAAAFPEAAFIHIVRDPRDVCLSYYRKKISERTGNYKILLEDEYPNTRYWLFFTQQAVRWQRWNSAIEKAIPPRYHLVRYEDLVSDPHRTMAAVCHFLGIGFDPAILNVGASRKLWSDMPHHRRLAEPVTAARQEQFRRLRRPLLRSVEDLTPLRDRYGYPRVTKSGFSPLQKLLGYWYHEAIREEWEHSY